MSDERMNKRPRAVIERDNYVPHFMTVIGNGIAWTASRLYVQHLGLGINECRIVTILGECTALTASQMSQILSMNKASVSRGLQVLEAKGYVRIVVSEGRRLVDLTPKGHRLHERIVPFALKREALLLRGFSEAEKQQLLGYLRRVYDNLPYASSHDPLAEEPE